MGLLYCMGDRARNRPFRRFPARADGEGQGEEPPSRFQTLNLRSGCRYPTYYGRTIPLWRLHPGGLTVRNGGCRPRAARRCGATRRRRWRTSGIRRHRTPKSFGCLSLHTCAQNSGVSWDASRGPSATPFTIHSSICVPSGGFLLLSSDGKFSSTGSTFGGSAAMTVCHALRLRSVLPRRVGSARIDASQLIVQCRAQASIGNSSWLPTCSWKRWWWAS